MTIDSEQEDSDDGDDDDDDDVDETARATTCPVHQSADHYHHRLHSAVTMHTMVSLSSPSTEGLVLPSSRQRHCQDSWHPPQWVEWYS